MFFMNMMLYREYCSFHVHVQKVFALQNTYQHYLSEMQAMWNTHYALREQFDACQTDVVLTTTTTEVSSYTVANGVQLVAIPDTVSFSWPLNRSSFWISSYFGPRKKPGGGTKFHYGIDMAALKGTPVYAAAWGEIVEADYARGYGNTVVVKHNATYETRYAHLHKILVEVGKKVKKGDCIGQVGDTGSVRKSGSDASHLHFEVYVAGKKVNPMKYLS